MRTALARDGASIDASFSPDLRRRAAATVYRTIGRRFLGPIQRARASQFAVLPARPSSIVMLGDSITEGGIWNEWFDGLPVLNRGIGGETARDLLERLDTAIADPIAVFLLIGTNDLSAGLSLKDITNDVAAVLDQIGVAAPGTPVIVQSVMPRTARYRDDLRLLNEAYQSLVAMRPHTRYLDLWPALADENGCLIRSYTEDKLHLNGDGYAAWLTVLRPLVLQLQAQHVDREPSWPADGGR